MNNIDNKKMRMYHIYPLGICGAPTENRDKETNCLRLECMYEYKEYFKDLGINTIYYGPVFQAESHGYDTIDYYNIDNRLGNNAMFASIVKSFSDSGINTVLDGVFNHVSRDFFAFQDLIRNGKNSQYRSWFYVNFHENSPYNDPFSYECWEGHFNLVKLNLSNHELREYLFGAVRQWILEFGIHGLRLDVAYALDKEFIRDLKKVCLALNPNFWLMGELIHGDYRQLLSNDLLDSATNYECYKGLFSSHNDKNYFEIAYSLNRLFGNGGQYSDFSLYNFVDNHDVSRASSILKNKAHLYPLYLLLMMMPGIPSIYYGSELGIEGDKNNGDEDLRLALPFSKAKKLAHENDLFRHISHLLRIRQEHDALEYGDYEQVYVSNEQLVFSRKTENEYLLILVSLSDEPVDIDLSNFHNYGNYEDLLNIGDNFSINDQNKRITLYPNWGRILRLR